MPTILELVGVEPGDALKKQLKGRSLVPLLQGKTSEGEDVYMETDYRLFTHKRGLRTTDGWKLIRTLETGKTELYDIKKDPNELEDLASRLPAKVEQMRLLLQERENLTRSPFGE